MRRMSQAVIGAIVPHVASAASASATNAPQPAVTAVAPPVPVPTPQPQRAGKVRRMSAAMIGTLVNVANLALDRPDGASSTAAHASGAAAKANTNAGDDSQRTASPQTVSPHSTPSSTPNFVRAKGQATGSKKCADEDDEFAPVEV